MANSVEPIFCLPSYFLKDCMSPTEFCNSLTFLPDESPLDLDAFHHWKSTPWGHTRHSVRPTVARDLHYGSSPDVDIDFTHTKAKCAAIGSGRPKPESPVLSKPKIFGKDWNSTSVASIWAAKLDRPKVSKFAKLFPSNESDGGMASVNPFDSRSHTVIVTPSPHQPRFKRDTIRSRRPKLEPHGDMSSLRPDDRGMDAATCDKFYRESTVPEARNPFFTTDSDNSNDSGTTTSAKVAFDLGAQYATRSTTEQKAKCKARGDQLIEEEAATFKEAVVQSYIDRLEDLTDRVHAVAITANGHEADTEDNERYVLVRTS